MSVFDRIKLGRIDFFVQILLAFISDSIKPLNNSGKQPITGQLRTSSTGIICYRAAELFDGLGRQIPVFTNQFQDSIINGFHPLRGLAHFVIWSAYNRHSSTDGSKFATKLYKAFTKLSMGVESFVVSYL